MGESARSGNQVVGREQMKTLTPELERELRRLKAAWPGHEDQAELEFQMCKLTTGLDEHPEWWDMPCECDLCLSYGE